jgi:hypothetical protein
MRPSQPGTFAQKLHDFLRGDGLKARMRIWRGFWRSTGYSRGIALKAAAGLTATWIGLRLAGFRRWKTVLVWFIPRETDSASSMSAALVDSAQAIAHIQQAAACHLVFHTNCLEQSLVLWWLLKRRDMAAELRIGARKEEGQFEAHAWVELGGAVLSDGGEGHLHFVPFEGSVVAMETQTH